jgi:uncharacterized RDD family membrane protein YckC
METKIIISKFWTRIWAFLIDSLVLGVIGYLFGLMIQDFLISIGSYGMILGLIIAVSYQTICNSELSNGQTLGKCFMGIHVVDVNGDLIGVGKSFLRALILSFPYFMCNLSIPGLADTSFISLVKTIGLLSIIIGVVVIYIFNKQTRQSLHDIIIGTYVATLEENDEPSTMPRVTKTPFYIFGGLVVLLIGSSIYSVNSNTAQNVPNIYTKVSKIEGVINANINQHTTYINGTTTLAYETTLSVKTLPDDDLEKEKVVRQTALTILSDVSNINNFDVITISLNRGFNIGIASHNSTKTVSYSPNKWRQILQQKNYR